MNEEYREDQVEVTGPIAAEKSGSNRLKWTAFVLSMVAISGVATAGALGGSGDGSGVMDELLRSHRISPEHLRADAFDAFYEQRRRDLLELISRVIGKSIVVESPPPTGEEGLPQIDDEEDSSAAVEEANP